jgi:hypothetical protein
MAESSREARERLAKQEGTLKALHVDRGIIARNRKLGCDLPAITIQTSRGSIKAKEVQILGPAILTQRKKRLSCGAVVFIATYAKLRWR